MSKIRAAITGIQGYLPDYVLTNSELEKRLDTTNEWIIERTGISERRLLKGEGLGTSAMAIPAVKGLLERTKTKPEEIDLIICATTTPDMVFPATANLIGAGVGAVNAFGFDLQAACSGFLYALCTASQYIETGRFKKVVVVGGDKMSSILDYTDRTTCVIFGDGAGAVMLEPNTEGYGLIDFVLRSDGAGAEHLYMKAGGSRYPASHQTVDEKAHYVTQHGPAVFKNAVQNMADVAVQIMQRNNLSSDDIAFLAPHQANKRIIEATANRMGISDEKVMMTIQKFGNTTSGTIPLSIWDYENKLKKGDNLVLAAFGGGFTWGSAYLKWAYDPQ